MCSKYSKTYESNNALLVEKKQLNNLLEFLKSNFREIYAKGKTIENTKINFSDYSELLSYQNHNKQKLIAINIICNDGIIDKKSNFEIELGFEI